MPKKKEREYTPQLDFKEQTPEIQFKEAPPDPLYEKAFLSREDTSVSEYARNTTTWD